jgi:hypothetical protein
MKVQHWIDDDRDSDDSQYEAVTCPACAAVHFTNPKSKKLFGEEE